MVERRAGALGPGQARSRQRRWPKARLYKGQAEPAIIATSRHGLLSLPFSGYRTCPRGTAPTLRTLAGYPRETAKSQFFGRRFHLHAVIFRVHIPTSDLVAGYS